ncbi:MAG: hypothetical protein V1709_00245 [Planctomycetota bacterium]
MSVSVLDIVTNGKTLSGNTTIQDTWESVVKFIVDNIGYNLISLKRFPDIITLNRYKDTKTVWVTEAKPFDIPAEETSQHKLTEKQIKMLQGLEGAFGILKDLSPEQLKEFDATVKRRPLFK